MGLPTLRSSQDCAAILPDEATPPPGNSVVWKGLSRLTDIHLGFLLAIQDGSHLRGREGHEAIAS
jgi:hypothetical protein